MGDGGRCLPQGRHRQATINWEKYGGQLPTEMRRLDAAMNTARERGCAIPNSGFVHIERVGREKLFNLDVTLQQILLFQIVDQRLNRLSVWLDAVGSEVAVGERDLGFFSFGNNPGQGNSQCVGIVQPANRFITRITEGLV
jgi:hypothetical protein